MTNTAKLNVIENNKPLLEKLISDYHTAPAPWIITPYWETYHHRILREINKSGIESLQSNYTLLKGFAHGGVPQPISPANDVKRCVFETIPKIPLISKVVDSHKRIINAQHKTIIKNEIYIAKNILAQIEEKFGQLNVPFDLTVGDADDGFEWRSCKITTQFVHYLARVADFYSTVPKEDVTSIVEIGSGLGWSTIAHRMFNDNIKLFINVDIPTTLYLMTQFLKSTKAFNVIDYTDFLKLDNYQIPAPSASETNPTCVNIPPWCFEKINQEVDWFHNAFSFQEMEPFVVNAYAAHTKKIVKKGAWLLSSIKGHKPGAGFQEETVDFEFIEKSFSPNFTRSNNESIKISSYHIDIDEGTSRILLA